MAIKRRTLAKAAALVPLSSTPLGRLSAQTAPHRVVVVGGGFAGATAAKYLKLWGGSTVDVVLVNSQPKHTSCVMSNLVLNGRLPLNQLRFDYRTLSSDYGVVFRQGKVLDIDPVSQQVRLDAGNSLNYDFLVLATGIAFDRPEGWDPRKMPHAWIAGNQTLVLKRQLDALAAGSTVVMSIPPAPYRCPPGPYERACLFADLLERRGGGRVVVLDANPGIQAEAETFGRAFSDLYGDTVEYYTDAELLSVDSATNSVETSLGVFTGDVVNIIPVHRATDLIRNAGLTAGGPWAPVDVTTYESQVTGFEGVHVIGDSQGSSQPKSAHMANAEAKVCADAILRRIAGTPTDSAERLDNLTTNSACYSPITYSEASYLTAVYRYNQADGQMALSHVGEAGRWNRGNFRDMFDWSDNLFADTFG